MKNQSNMKHSAILLMVGMLLASVLPKAAWAQQVLPYTEPGVIMRGLEEEKRAPSRLEETVVVPKEEAGKSISTQKVFVLKSVVLEGTIVYRGVDLTPVYKDMLGQQVSFADLNAIAQRVTRKYREDGYIFSRAVLPPQKISDGVVRLQAVEGRISGVRLVGTYHDKTGLIERMAEKIRTSGVTNTKEIERYLLLIDDLPGITAKSFIKPSTTPGGGDLIINVEEDSFEGSASFDNRGSGSIGPYRGTLVGAFNSAFGRHDRTTLRVVGATQISELKFGEITHEEQIGSEGGKIKARAAITSSNPGGNVSVSRIEGASRLFDLEGSYPLLRSRAYNVNLQVGVNALNSETDVSSLLVARDRVRSVRAGVNVDFTDSLKGVNQIDLIATQGLDTLGATNDGGTNLSRANGKHTFLKANLTATRIQELWHLWSLRLSGTGQASNDPLLASEEFTVGGASFGRAYDSGEIAGDYGWAGVTELRYGGRVDNEFITSYQAYTYIDYGKIRQHSSPFGEVSRDSLTSTGLGLRFNLKHDLSGYLEVNKPLNKKVASEADQDSRLFFSLLKRF